MTEDIEDRISKSIKKVISDLMENLLNKVLIVDPFIKEDHYFKKPIYAALVPDEIFKGSHFERRFVTPFGSVWEKLALIVGEEFHGVCIKGHVVEGLVGDESLRRIQEVLNKLEHTAKGDKPVRPDWDKELKYIKSGGGNLIPTSVVTDIYIENNETGKKYAFELKAPLPNSDQTKVSKEKLFKLLCMSDRKSVV